MKRMLIIWFFIFSGSLFSMEGEDEVSVEEVPLIQDEFSQLVYHIAAMTVVNKIQSDLYIKDMTVSCCTRSLPVPKCVCKHPFAEVAYVEFIKENGKSDIRHIVRALKGEEDIEAVLKDYREKSFTMHEIFSRATIDYGKLEESVKQMLSEDQKEYFSENLQQLSDAPALWMASRMALLEWMRHLNKKPSLTEKCADFCDRGTSFGPGICTGLGIASCTSGNFLLGTILMLIGGATCLNFKGHAIQDLNFNCSGYWLYAREETDLKLSTAMSSLALYKTRSNS